eukprot:5367162-Amphidinium_carterae.1
MENHWRCAAHGLGFLELSGYARNAIGFSDPDICIDPTTTLGDTRQRSLRIVPISGLKRRWEDMCSNMLGLVAYETHFHFEPPWK